MSAASQSRNRELVLLGRIAGAHGLKGEVKISTFTAKPEDVAAYGPLTDTEERRQFFILSLRTASGSAVIARLRGIANRNEAEKLSGVDLYVPRAALPPPKDVDEYYYSDLIGLDVVLSDGKCAGKIIAVHNFGAGDLLELSLLENGRSEFIPFDSTHVPKVDLTSGRVTVVRPRYEADEGLES